MPEPNVHVSDLCSHRQKFKAQYNNTARNTFDSTFIFSEESSGPLQLSRLIQVLLSSIIGHGDSQLNTDCHK